MYNCTNFYSSGDVYNCNTGINAYATSGVATGYIYNNNTGVLSWVSSNVQVSLAHMCESINYDFSVEANGYISSYESYFKNGQPRIHNSGGTVTYGSTHDMYAKNKCQRR